MNTITKFFSKIGGWYNKTLKPKTAKASALMLAILLAGIMVFSLFASIAQTNWGRTEVVDIYANIGGLGDNISMTLYKPKKASAENKVPFVCATHGYLNNKEMVDMSYVELSRRGYAVVAVDASVMGDYHGESGAIGGTAGGLVEVIDYFTQILPDGSQMFPWLDFSNIGVIGHSMGGRATNTTVTTYGTRETTAFRALRTKYMAAPYSFDFTGVAATASSGVIYNRLIALIGEKPDYAAEIKADIADAKAQNKIRAALPMAPFDGQLATGMGLETIYGTIIGGRDEMFLTNAGAAVAINNVNTQKRAIDERNTMSWFQTKREYSNQNEYIPLNNYASPMAAALVGAINPDYLLANSATIFGEAGTGKEVFSRPTLPRDDAEFAAAGITSPLTSADAAIVSEYKAYLSKKEYFDKIWKILRDWNGDTSHVQVAAPTTSLTLLKTVEEGGAYSEGKLIPGGIYTKTGLNSDVTWKTGFNSTPDANGLRPVYRTFYISGMEIHPWNHFSTTSAGYVSTFFMTSFGKSSVGTNYAPGNQGWWVKEMFNFFAMLCFLCMIVPLASLFSKLPFFAKVAQPVPQATARLKKWYEWVMFLVPAGLLAFFSGWSILEFTAGAGYGIFSSFFNGTTFPNQTTTNYVATWAFVNAIVGFVVFALMYFIWTKPRARLLEKASIQVSSSGASAPGGLGIKTKPGGIFRSLILAVMTVSCALFTVGIVDYFFATDFRIWTFCVKWFHSFKLDTAIMYMFIFIFYYVMLALSVANNRWKNIPEWLSTLICALLNIVGMVALQAVSYGSAMVVGGAWTASGSAGSLQLIGLFPLIPVVFCATILSRKLYKISGSIWLPAFVNTILFTIMSVTGTIIAGGWYKIFGL